MEEKIKQYETIIFNLICLIHETGMYDYEDEHEFVDFLESEAGVPRELYDKVVSQDETNVLE